MAQQQLTPKEKIELAEKLVYRAKERKSFKDKLITTLNEPEFLVDKTPLTTKSHPKTVKAVIQKLPDAKLREYIILLEQPVKEQTDKEQQKPPTKREQAVRKGGTGEAMSVSDQISLIPKKTDAKQPVYQEENKSIGKSVRGSVYSDIQSQSSWGSAGSSKSHQLLETLSNDSKLTSKIPQITQAKQNVLKGNITQEQADQQISQAIIDGMSSSINVKSTVMDIIQQSLKSDSQSQKSSKSSKSVNIQMQKQTKSAFGSVPQSFDDQDVPKKDESNSLAGQSQQIPKPMIGAVFGQDDTVKNNLMPQIKERLDKISSQRSGTVEGQKAEQIRKSLEKNDIQSQQAMASISAPHIVGDDQPVQEQNVSKISTSPQLDQKEKTITDAINDPMMKQYAEDLILKSGQTEEQKALSMRTLRDVGSLTDLVSRQLEAVGYPVDQDDQSQNYDQFMETGGLNNRNKQKGKARTVKGKNQGIDMQSDDISGVGEQIRGIDPKSRGTSQLFDVGGSKVTEEFIKEVMKETIDKISKLVGDLPTIATYSTFKNQTEVFGTKVQKKESTAFAVKQGSAFRLRQCQ